MSFVQLNFRQYCYTHAHQGVSSLQKGWQIVGQSGDNDFKAIATRITFLHNLNELQQLADGYTVFGLHVIDGFAVMLKITDAGQTSDGRPGNIFVHAIVPDVHSKERFWQCDVFDLFHKEFWLTQWQGKPDPDMAPLSVKVPQSHDETCYVRAKNYAGDKDRLKVMVLAANEVLDPRQSRYLIIHPQKHDQSNMELDEAIDFFRIAWAWIPISRRRLINCWLGRDMTRISGVKWLVLVQNGRSKLDSSHQGRNALGFDFVNQTFTPLSEIKSQSWHDLEFSDQVVRDRSELADQCLNQLFDYKGTNLAKTDSLLDWYIKHQAALASPRAMQTVIDILTKIRPGDPADEPFYSFVSLLNYFALVVKYKKNFRDGKPLLEKAFDFQLSAQNALIFKRQSITQVVHFYARLLSSNPVKIFDSEFLRFNNWFFEQFDLMVRKNPTLNLPVSFETMWPVTMDLLGSSEDLDTYWPVFKALVYWDVIASKSALRSRQEFLLPLDPIVKKSPGDAEKVWYYKMVSLLTKPQIPALSSCLIELVTLYLRANSDQETRLVNDYLENNFTPKDRLLFWATAYKHEMQGKNQSLKKALLDNYLNLLADSEFRDLDLDSDKCLMKIFLETGQDDLVTKEIVYRIFPFLKEQPGHPINTFPQNHSEQGWQPRNSSTSSPIQNYFYTLFSTGHKNLPGIFRNVLQRHAHGSKTLVSVGDLDFCGQNLCQAWVLYVTDEKPRLTLEDISCTTKDYQQIINRYGVSPSFFYRDEITDFRKSLLKMVLDHDNNDSILTLNDLIRVCDDFELADLIKKNSEMVFELFREVSFDSSKLLLLGAACAGQSDPDQLADPLVLSNMLEQEKGVQALKIMAYGLYNNPGLTFEFPLDYCLRLALVRDAQHLASVWQQLSLKVETQLEGEISKPLIQLIAARFVQVCRDHSSQKVLLDYFEELLKKLALFIHSQDPNIHGKWQQYVRLIIALKKEASPLSINLNSFVYQFLQELSGKNQVTFVQYFFKDDLDQDPSVHADRFRRAFYITFWEQVIDLCRPGQSDEKRLELVKSVLHSFRFLQHPSRIQFANVESLDFNKLFKIIFPRSLPSLVLEEILEQIPHANLKKSFLGSIELETDVLLDKVKKDYVTLMAFASIVENLPGFGYRVDEGLLLYLLSNAGRRLDTRLMQSILYVSFDDPGKQFLKLIVPFLYVCHPYAFVSLVNMTIELKDRDLEYELNKYICLGMAQFIKTVDRDRFNAINRKTDIENALKDLILLEFFNQDNSLFKAYKKIVGSSALSSLQQRAAHYHGRQWMSEVHKYLIKMSRSI